MSNVTITNHPLIEHKLSILRDVNTNPTIFRQLVSELGALLCYEATRDLPIKPVEVQTPLTTMTAYEMQESIALIPILRAGLGMVEGIWALIPNAHVFHIGFYRNEQTLEPVEYYNKLPKNHPFNTCLILDPMLATGGSAIATTDIIKRWGAKKIKFVGLIGAPEGIRALQEVHPDVDIHLAAIDDHLNEKGYIVPGLGDAGDRQFGTVF
ncbi:uracil phosphoribosyltransferase [Flexilinea flocculi]|jgi:uracil phosphoribosyltransferase|uniref:Uracil phosphoribosyltransferase n=1 Tax=Flexilinea flocculi TaxID=1678840 RepID=A0A0S7BUC4_9CHLR|nr:uracil phosphoribosyltransferase [Flexilinea flocculi]NMB94216.1 uracil phosphoribosyltransferase [Flexilinea flocculi]GAP41650.1 uracil phosphoribosyltransferase [Flexilinea flocculi]